MGGHRIFEFGRGTCDRKSSLASIAHESDSKVRCYLLPFSLRGLEGGADVDGIKAKTFSEPKDKSRTILTHTSEPHMNCRAKTSMLCQVAARLSRALSPRWQGRHKKVIRFTVWCVRVLMCVKESYQHHALGERLNENEKTAAGGYTTEAAQARCA